MAFPQPPPLGRPLLMEETGQGHQIANNIYFKPRDGASDKRHDEKQHIHLEEEIPNVLRTPDSFINMPYGE